MMLGRGDLGDVLSFLVDVGELEFDEPYPVEFLARLQRLVPCDAVTYQDCDLQARQFTTLVAVGPEGQADDGDEGDEDLYWSASPCPISEHRLHTGDLSVIRMSDVVGRRRYRELPLFREYFGPAGLDHLIDVGLPTAPGRHRSLILFRAIGVRDFAERDRRVLELLQPHLRRIEELAALRRRVDDLFDRQADDGAVAAYNRLTAREREIVGLVAEGKTNAQIAAELWVAPGTVKKHLENVYEKIGVSGRAAAARLAPEARWLA